MIGSGKLRPRARAYNVAIGSTKHCNLLAVRVLVRLGFDKVRFGGPQLVLGHVNTFSNHVDLLVQAGTETVVLPDFFPNTPVLVLCRFVLQTDPRARARELAQVVLGHVQLALQIRLARFQHAQLFQCELQ